MVFVLALLLFSISFAKNYNLLNLYEELAIQDELSMKEFKPTKAIKF